jgi:hypothetical protein
MCICSPYIIPCCQRSSYISYKPIVWMHLRIAFSRMDSGISPHPQRVEGRPISAGIRSSSHFTASKDGFCRLFDLASFLRDVRHGSQSKRSITHSLPYFTWCFTSVALCGHSQHAVAQHRTPPSVFCWVAQPGPPSSGCISSFFPLLSLFSPVFVLAAHHPVGCRQSDRATSLLPFIYQQTNHSSPLVEGKHNIYSVAPSIAVANVGTHSVII